MALVAKRMTSAPIRLAPVFPPTEERDGLTASKAGYAMLLIYLWIVQAYYCRPRQNIRVDAERARRGSSPAGRDTKKSTLSSCHSLQNSCSRAAREMPVSRAARPERCQGPPGPRGVPGRPRGVLGTYLGRRGNQPSPGLRHQASSSAGPGLTSRRSPSGSAAPAASLATQLAAAPLLSDNVDAMRGQTTSLSRGLAAAGGLTGHVCSKKTGLTTNCNSFLFHFRDPQTR
jgi:hypothetical protein